MDAQLAQVERPCDMLRRDSERESNAYPADIDLVKRLIADVENQRADIKETLLEQGFDLKDDISLVPFYAHRYVVCSRSEEDSPVLSIMGTDAIVYAPDLRSYLEVEFLAETKKEIGPD